MLEVYDECHVLSKVLHDNWKWKLPDQTVPTIGFRWFFSRVHLAVDPKHILRSLGWRTWALWFCIRKVSREGQMPPG